MDQQGDFGENRAAKGGKKHRKHAQNEKPEERKASTRYQELKREVKRRCRRDRRCM